MSTVDDAWDCGLLLGAIDNAIAGFDRGVSPSIIEHSLREAVSAHRARRAVEDARRKAYFESPLPTCAVPEAPEFMRNAPRSATGD